MVVLHKQTKTTLKGSTVSKIIAAAFIAFLSSTSTGNAAEFKLAIQPILPQQQLIDNFQPLADYLSKETGHTITIATQRNFLFYWTKMRKQKKGFDLVLDAAHLTDYRVKNFGYNVIVKMPDTVSLSIVTRNDKLIFDINDLIGLRVATMHSPSMGSVRLEALFPNPSRMPHYVYELNTTTAIKNIISGETDAAIIPTRLVEDYPNLNIVLTTTPIPHMALSAAPTIPTDVTEKIRNALINASTTASGRAMLALLKVEQFETANNATYDGYSELLKDAFGYIAPTQ